MIEIYSNANFCFKMKNGTSYFERGKNYRLHDNEIDKVKTMQKMNFATISNKAFFPDREEKVQPDTEFEKEEKAESVKKDVKKKPAKKTKK